MTSLVCGVSLVLWRGSNSEAGAPATGEAGTHRPTSRLPVAEVSRRGRGATGGDVARLAALSRLGEHFLQRRRLQHG